MLFAHLGGLVLIPFFVGGLFVGCLGSLVLVACRALGSPVTKTSYNWKIALLTPFSILACVLGHFGVLSLFGSLDSLWVGPQYDRIPNPIVLGIWCIVIGMSPGLLVVVPAQCEKLLARIFNKHPKENPDTKSNNHPKKKPDNKILVYRRIMWLITLVLIPVFVNLFWRLMFFLNPFVVLVLIGISPLIAVASAKFLTSSLEVALTFLVRKVKQYS